MASTLPHVAISCIVNDILGNTVIMQYLMGMFNLPVLKVLNYGYSPDQDIDFIICNLAVFMLLTYLGHNLQTSEITCVPSLADVHNAAPHPMFLAL